MAQKSLIQMIFNEEYIHIPSILQKHYSLIPYTTDNVLLNGVINVSIARMFNLITPLFKIINGPPPYAQQNIPVTVNFSSKHNSNHLSLYRAFHYTDRRIHNFNTKIIYHKDNIVLECMRFNFVAKLVYSSQPNKIIIDYGGYFLKIGGLLIPLPLKWIIGKFSAYQEQIDDAKFIMLLKLEHRLFGQVYQFRGTFNIEKVND